MMKKIISFLLIAFWGISFSQVNAGTRIFTIGDSTMANYDEETNSGENEKRGWAQMFSQFFIGDIAIHNHGKNGASSKSFYNDGTRWTSVRDQLTSNDYVFIQFGHNDEKNNGAEGIAGTDGAVGTAPWGDYRNYLRKYVEETRAKGATPILLTPVVRRYFSGNTITAKGKHNLSTDNDSILNYPRAMKSVARELNVPLIDHTTLTEVLVLSYGDNDSKKILYANDDNTHLKIMGATVFARLVAQDMIRQNILTDYVNAESDLLINPSSYDFGEKYTGTNIIKQFLVSAMDLSPANGNIKVSATLPFSVSSEQNGTYGQEIQIPYTSGGIVTTIYIRFSPNEGVNYEDNLTISVEGTEISKNIPLSGKGLSLDGGVRGCVIWPLTASISPSIDGPLSAVDQSFSQLQNYGFREECEFPDGTKQITQRIATLPESGTNAPWPGGEIDINENRYAQFAVTVPEDAIFYVDSIGFYAGATGGGGVRFSVLISSKADFTDEVSLLSMEAGGNKVTKAYSFSPTVKLAGGETFYLRFYPWYNGAATQKYLCLQNVAISGIISMEEGSSVSSQTISEIKHYVENDILYLNNLPQQTTIQLYNLQGQCIFQQNIRTENISLPLKANCIVRITSDNGSKSIKIIR